MTGGVYKRGSTYSYVVDAGKEGGKRKQVWVGGFRTRREALAARAEALLKIHAGTYVPTTRETLTEFVEEWLGTIRSTVRESTWKSYGSLLRLHVLPTLGATQLKELRPAQLNKLYADLMANGRRNGTGGLSRRTVRYIHTVLHRALRDAVRWGRVVRNVADLADPPAAARAEMKVWSGEQLKRFLAHVASDRLYACYLLAATTGMRRGELLGLRWQDVDLEEGWIAIRQTLVSVDYALHFSEPKTKRSRRTIGIDPATVAALKTHRARQHAERLAWGALWKDEGLVFIQEDGSLVHPQSLSEAFERYAKAAELPVIRFHDIRHTYATLALEAGMRPWDLSDRLGHSDTSMALDVYRHAIRSTQDEAACRAARFILGNE